MEKDIAMALIVWAVGAVLFYFVWRAYRRLFK